jgi:hypothetical protein
MHNNSFDTYILVLMCVCLCVFTTLHYHRGVVGDTIVVNFRNYATYVYVDSVEVDNGDDDEFLMINATFNLAPTGLYADHKAAIGYEGVEQYTWTVGKNANTGLSSTTVWTYKSDAVESGNEKNQFEFGYDSGVFGPIVVVDPAYIMNNDQKTDAFPCDIDEEVNLAFMETSESNSVYYKWNLHDFFDKKYHDKYREEAEFAIPNTKRSINGHMYGNLGASTGMEFDYGTKVRFNVIVQNTTMNWIPKEDEHEHEDAYMWGPSQGWTNITVNMGHEMGGSMVHNFDGKSTQTLDYQCMTEGTVLIDVELFNMYGVSSYFTTLEDDGTFVHEQQSSGGSKTSSAGEAVGIVFACIFCFFLGGLVVYAREIILKTETYAKCMDDSTSEVVELNGEGVKSNDV